MDRSYLRVERVVADHRETFLGQGALIFHHVVQVLFRIYIRVNAPYPFVVRLHLPRRGPS
jgi:hypothetical protein